MSTTVLDQTAPVFPVPKSPPELKLLTSQQIANNYYNGKPAATGQGYKIYADEPVFYKDIEEVKVYKSRFSKKIGEIDLVLFASKNGAFLLQRYLEAVPQSKELILFLEIDDKYNYNTVLRAKAGPNLTQKDSDFPDIIAFARSHEVTITPKVLKELIDDEIYRNKVSFISWFLGLKDVAVSKVFNFFTKEILTSAAKYFEQAFADNVLSWRIPEEGWNPKKENYDPALIPDALSKELKRYFEHTDAPNNPYVGLEGQKKIVSKIVTTLFEKIDAAKGYFLGVLDQAEKLNFFPEILFKRIRKAARSFFDQFDKIEKFLKNPTTRLQAIVYKGYQTANAFLCGIYNSLIDIIAGLFSIIGFLFRGVAAMADANANSADYGEMFMELMENMLDGVLSFDYAAFFIRWIGFELRALVNMASWASNLSGLPVESIAYYFGYIVGLIIDIIVETLLTGGTAAVAKLLDGMAAFIKNPLQKLGQAVDKIMGATKNFLDKIIEFITFISNRLKKGVEEIFTDLNKFLDEVFGFGQKVEDNALTPSEKRVKDKNKAQAERLAERQNRLDRKIVYRKYASKFEKGFFNHLEGEFNTKTFTSRTGINKSEALVSQGGHSSEAIGKSLKLKGNPIPDPIKDDLPYKSKIEIKYRDGFLEKEAMSSMFPKNWNMRRIQEEVAFVYENTVAKGKGIDPKTVKRAIQNYKGKSTNGFDILIQTDKNGNILNAYPLIK